MTVKAILLLSFLSFAAGPKPATNAVSVVDFVKIKNNKASEAIYFYTNNWQLYREIALQKKYIKSYKLLWNKSDTSASHFDLMLITTYKDSTQYKESEANFAFIIKQERPNGPKLLNKLKPADFRENVSTKFTEEIASD